MTTSPHPSIDPGSQPPPPPRPEHADPTSPVRSRGWWWIALLIIAAAAGYWIYAKYGANTNVTRASGEVAPGSVASGQGQGAKGGQGGKGAQGGQGGGNRALPVIAQEAKKGDMDVFLSALGSVAPQNSVTVRTRVDGQLMRVAFREGQMVKAGDVLAEVDPRQFQVQLAQAEGQMAKDQALLKNAKVDVERYTMLFAQDSIAKQQLDTQVALVGQFEGTLKADQAQIDAARLQLTYARVTAPIGGRLGLRQVDVGNVVHPGDANGIVVIAQVRPISVLFTLPEDSLGGVVKRMREGAKLQVEAYDREQKVKLATGVLLTIDNQIDPTTGTIKLKAQFANDDEGLFPNQFVNVRMLINTIHDAVLIPSAAIQRGSQGTFVYVVKEDLTVTVRPIVIGPVLGEVSSIAKGLEIGERVVVDGADKLREGGKVELITREAQSAPGPGARRGQARDGQPRDGQRGEKGRRGATGGAPQQ
ncbi:MAG: MdtA/MuxA family multidrug efflux RND transporter periplasmic adaptor subunit [Betaproteobacteria bacterium]